MKKERTPFEAYSATPGKYQEVIERVQGFMAQPFVKREKLRRFLLEDMAGEFDDFQSRQLKASTMTIGQGERQRWVEPGKNHHMAVYETLDVKGRPTWTGVATSLFEAKQRTGRKEPVVRRNVPELGRYLFSLSSGDVVAFLQHGVEALWRVRSVSKRIQSACNVEVAPLTDARLKEQIKADRLWLMRSVKGSSHNLPP